MARILYITQLYPSDSFGGGQRAKNTIYGLWRAGHLVNVCCFADKSFPYKKIKKKGLQIYGLNKKILLSPFSYAFLKVFTKSLFSSLPFRMFKFQDKKMEALILSLQKKKKYDYVFLDFASSLQYMVLVKSPVFYLEHNLETSLVKQRYAKTKGIEKVFWFWEFLKTKKYEKNFLPRVTKIFAVNKNDKIKLKNYTDNPVVVMPTVVKTSQKLGHTKALKIVFTGLLSWPENKEGLIWFINNCWPSICLKCPKVEFLVIGLNADKKLLKLMADKGVVYLGYVKNLGKIYKENPVAIAPILGGSGIKMKILSYMSYGLAIVSTTKGAVGINKKALLLADSAQNFSQAVIQLLKNEKERSILGLKAKEIIRKDYSEERLINFLKKHL